ncbi:MAG TPA: rhomboid family intramembrane serine protease [Atribacteraceae bacterium]|nr:rhomboid family intramembrane serine protease [Atribacteraceae bacterium]
MFKYIIVINGLFFLATIASGGFATPNLIELGAKHGPRIAAGEWQRLLISIFLHGSLWHLLFNSYALFYLGKLCEEVFGSRKFFGIYIVTGIAGSILSYFWNFHMAGVGASGAIFGLAGAIFASGLKHRNTSLNRLGMSILPFILINLLIGFVVPAIDNAAHIGGLLAGMGMGWLLRPGTYRRGWKNTVEEALNWTLIAFVAFSMVSFFVPGLSSARVSVEQVVAFHNEAQALIEGVRTGSLPSFERVERLRPPDREAREIVRNLETLILEGGRDTLLLSRVEEDFQKWRGKILTQYEGLIYETSNR